MDFEEGTPMSSAISLGTGYYNDNDDCQKVVVFKKSARKPSEATTARSPTCRRNNDGIADNALPEISAFPRVDILQNNTHPLALSSFLTTPDGRIESTPSTWDEASIMRTSALWGLTTRDLTNLIELGNRLQDIGGHSKNNPADVVRFLVASSSDVNSAETKFRKMVSWRKQHDVDQILLNYHPPKELVDHYPGAVLAGLDNEGDPIFLSRLGVTDAAGMLQRYGHNEMINHAIWLRELLCTGQWMQEYEKIHKRPVKRALVIEDVHGIQLLQIACNRPLLSLYADIMRLDQDNFPEAAKKIIIIRAPALFHIIWNVVQHFFDANVREKMIFTTRNNYIEILSQHLDISVLPSCIIPEFGKGCALEGMPSNFEGGRLPLQQK